MILSRLSYFETSAATGQNVNKAVECLLDKVMQRMEQSTERGGSMAKERNGKKIGYGLNEHDEQSASTCGCWWRPYTHKNYKLNITTHPPGHIIVDWHYGPECLTYNCGIITPMLDLYNKMFRLLKMLIIYLKQRTVGYCVLIRVS